MLPPSPKPYSINDFIEWNARKEITLSPKYQRRAVWSEKARSYLIDTIIRGFPIPKLFIRHDIDMKTKKSMRELVDGQQRLRTILSYVDDGFKLLKVHNKEFGGKYFSELPQDIQKRILKYEISVDVLNEASDNEILEMFARINTYTVTLNKQEILNSKYFGAFKTIVYKLGYEFVQFWMSSGILTEKEVTRMSEALFASELTITILDGIQSRKTIENYYKKYDDEFSQADNIKKIFRANMDAISEIFSVNLKDSPYASKPLFYTLFTVINALREDNLLIKKNYSRIFNELSEIGSFVENPPDELSGKALKFINACTKSVTDADSRKIRHDYLLSLIKSKIK